MPNNYVEYKNEVSFEYLKSLFPSNEWDVGVISAETLYRCSVSPIKNKFHRTGADFTNNTTFHGLTNTLILIRDGETFDYSHYDQAVSILRESKYENWFQIYTNFKESAIFAGLGVRAKNSLIYSYKFGFDCHICAIGITDKIIDLPTNKRVNNKFWRRCQGCDDCANACPVNAIHNKEEPYWLNSDACDNFIGRGEHEQIPSMYTFWKENVYNDVEENKIQQILDSGVMLPMDRNGYHFDGNVIRKDGIPIKVAFCRECTSQPRCSKWNGKYPYETAIKEIGQPIKFYK
jgi:ferredoxin